MTDVALGKSERTFVHQDSKYAWFVTVLLTAAYSLSFIDRQVLNLLVEPIKADFQLTDSQVSLLQGLAFTSAFIAMGPLFGRWADTGNRRNVLIIGVIIWSAFTVLCGFSGGYIELFGARMGVGAAEACLIPAVYSMLPDYFRRETLPRAMSVFLMGSYIGGGLALIFGGAVIRAAASGDTMGLPLLGEMQPWQIVFIAVGLPGLVMAALLLTVQEPPRQGESAASAQRATLGEVGRYFWQHRVVYGCFFGGMSLHLIILYAFPAWVPSFLARVFKMELATIGFQYGILVLCVGMVGVLSGPVLGRWLTRRGYEDAPFRVPVIAACALIPACALLPFCTSYAAVIPVLILVTFLYGFPLAMATTALQMVTPNRMRGIAASIYVFTVSVMGLGLAPTLIALTTDYVFEDPMKVGWSLAIVCSLAAAGCAFLMYRGMRPFREALKAQG